MGSRGSGADHARVPGHNTESAYHPPSMAGYRLGVDVGGTFTDLAAVGPDGVVVAKVPSTPDDQSRGACRPGRRAWNRRAGRLRARHDRGDERAARAPRRATGAGHHRGLPRRARDRRARRAPTSTTCGAPPGRSCRASCRFDRARAAASRDGVLRAARRGERRRPRVAGCARPAPRPSPSACSSATCNPAHERAVGGALAAALPGVRVALSHRRRCPSSASTSAPRRPSRQRLPRAAARRLPARARRARPPPRGSPALLVMASSAG